MMEKAALGKNYRVHLSSFEGPLDLLLYLIKEAKIDIKDIFVSEVTKQYLKYMEDIGDLDMEKASEFLEIAATLLEIKSNSLLPKLEEIFPEQEDPAQKMIRQLEEYKLFKELSEKLRELETVDRYYRVADDSVFAPKVVLKDMRLDDLLDAFSRLLVKVERKKHDMEEPREIYKDPFTVDEKIEFIRSSLAERRTMSFFEFFDENATKDELIATFQALLELIKEQFLTVCQKAIFGDIILTIREGSAIG